MFINAVIYTSNLVMFSKPMSWLRTSEKIEIHFFKSFILTAVYELQWKYQLKVGKSCPNCIETLSWWRVYWTGIPLLFRTVSSENPSSLYQWHRRKSNWQYSSGGWRESGREGEIRGRPAGPAKAEKHQHVKLTDTGWSDFHVPWPIWVLRDLTLLYTMNEDCQPHLSNC